MRSTRASHLELLHASPSRACSNATRERGISAVAVAAASSWIAATEQREGSLRGGSEFEAPSLRYSIVCVSERDE